MTTAAQAITMCCEIFNRKATPMLLSGYLDALGLPDEAIVAACHRAVTLDDRMPTPARLRELASSSADSFAAAAVEAWASLLEAMAAYGAYESVQLHPPQANDVVVALGGWPMLCRRSDEDLHVWARRDFCSQLESRLRAGVPARQRYCAGLFEAYNVTHAPDQVREPRFVALLRHSGYAEAYEKLCRVDDHDRPGTSGHITERSGSRNEPRALRLIESGDDDRED